MQVQLNVTSTRDQCYGDEAAVWIMELEIQLAAWCSNIKRSTYSADAAVANHVYKVVIDTDSEYSALCASLMNAGYEYTHWRNPNT